jgi:homocysteine S-methyltransferase
MRHPWRNKGDAMTSDFPGVFVIDGGLSTQLERRGHTLADPLWTARTLIEQPNAIQAAHVDFIEAGADVIITASYQVSTPGFLAAALTESDAHHALVASVEVARRAVHEANSHRPVLVAASVGPYGAITHDGAEYRGRYGLSHQELVDFHRARIDVLTLAAPDLLAIETIPDVDEINALADVLDGSIPNWVCITAQSPTHLWSGHTIEAAVAAINRVPGVCAIGINCTAPEHVGTILKTMREHTELPLITYPNAGGTWDPQSAMWNAPPVDLAEMVNEWRRLGAVGIGGCCGTDADAIARVASFL